MATERKKPRLRRRIPRAPGQRQSKFTPAPAEDHKPAPGAARTLSRQMILAARMSGELPHEFLLRVMRGDEFDDYYIHRGKRVKITRPPTFAERVDAAKAAAPYFAARLSAKPVDLDGGLGLGRLSNDELDIALQELLSRELEAIDGSV